MLRIHKLGRFVSGLRHRVVVSGKGHDSVQLFVRSYRTNFWYPQCPVKAFTPGLSETEVVLGDDQFPYGDYDVVAVNPKQEKKRWQPVKSLPRGQRSNVAKVSRFGS